MAKTPKYPNPAFFRTKNNMDWKAQGENRKIVQAPRLTPR